MHPLFTETFFPQYLSLSIEIFHKKYPGDEIHPYKNHPKWTEFTDLLKESGVNKIFICLGIIVGDISKQYFHSPITENSPSEEKVREKYFIVEEINL